MKKKLILFATLVVTLCSASAARADFKLTINNNTDFDIKFELFTVFCPRAEVILAPGSQGNITVGDLCGLTEVKATRIGKPKDYAQKKAWEKVRTFDLIKGGQYKEQIHNVHMEGGQIQITSPMDLYKTKFLFFK